MNFKTMKIKSKNETSLRRGLYFYKIVKNRRKIGDEIVKNR